VSSSIQSTNRQREAARPLPFHLLSALFLSRRAFSGWGIRCHARRFLTRLRYRKEILASAWESFRGHLGILSAKEECPVDLGPAFERDARGYIQENTRTAARNQHIEKLLSVHPWSDPMDLETFLLGFDAGEQYASCDKGKESDSECDSKTAISA